MKIITMLATGLLSLLLLAGCEEGPAEDAAEDMGSSMEEAGEDLDEAMEDAEEEMNDAGEELEEAIEE